MRVSKSIVHLNISLIEKQHKQILNFINRVVIAGHQGDNQKDIVEIVNDMCQYACETFEIEESYIKAFHCPDYQKHIAEHRSFSIMTLYFLVKVDNKDYQITDELFEFLHKWLINHIYGIDGQRIGCCIKSLFN